MNKPTKNSSRKVYVPLENIPSKVYHIIFNFSNNEINNIDKFETDLIINIPFKVYNGINQDWDVLVKYLISQINELQISKTDIVKPLIYFGNNNIVAFAIFAIMRGLFSEPYILFVKQNKEKGYIVNEQLCILDPLEGTKAGIQYKDTILQNSIYNGVLI